MSGSGRSTAYAIGILNGIVVDAPPTVQALCVLPTREHATSLVECTFRPLTARLSGFRINLSIPGDDGNVNVEAEGGAHLVVGTPNLVADLIRDQKFDLAHVRTFVLDHAECILHPSVGPSHRNANDIRLIKQSLPENCQCLIFADISHQKVESFAYEMTKNPDVISIEEGSQMLALHSLRQRWVDVRNYGKEADGRLEFLDDVYALLNIGQSIIFVGNNAEADAVSGRLYECGYGPLVIRDDADSAVRDAALEAFQNADAFILITTETLEREDAMCDVNLVVNYSLPFANDGLAPDFWTYLGRVTLAGRFGRTGTAVSLVSDALSMKAILAIKEHYSREGLDFSAAEPDPEVLVGNIEI